MSLKEQEEQQLGPFTLEEAKQEISRLAYIADGASDAVAASNVLIANILIALHSSKIINAVSLLEWIRIDSKNLEDAKLQSSVEALSTLMLLEFELRRTYGSN